MSDERLSERRLRHVIQGMHPSYEERAHMAHELLALRSENKALDDEVEQLSKDRYALSRENARLRDALERVYKRTSDIVAEEALEAEA